VGTQGRKNPSSARRTRRVQGPQLVPGSANPSAPGAQGNANVRPQLTVVSSNVRWGKVKTAQARMAVDFYDREDVKAHLLDAVLEELERP